MTREVYRDSSSAWRGLKEIGALDLDDRDDDLLLKLRKRLDETAPDLDTALASASIDRFLEALFQVIQPFALMFRDVLDFFEQAGAREGQTQWRVAVGKDFVDLRNFEEFLEHWHNIECELEVPAIDRASAFLPNDVRIKIGGPSYLRENEELGGYPGTALPDVDAWLAEYAQGRYGTLPESLRPENFGPGLDDASRIVAAALSVIRRQGLNRADMLSQHRSRSHESDERDALHPWTIAQSETDFWLRSCVLYLANLLTRSEAERTAFGTELAKCYAKFPRRRMIASIQVKDVERLLSLPAWKKRYEFYGVWVATEIVRALEGHEIRINHTKGELRFAFSEARIAEIASARPQVSLFCERRTPLADPVGKHRKSSVQPDYGIWKDGRGPEQCVLVVEVKHYKKRSKRNFQEAIVDYARAHPEATVVLVNYGPVGIPFGGVSDSISRRCTMIGYMSPDCRSAREQFREIVRNCVGNPAPATSDVTSVHSPSVDTVMLIDISGSMRDVLGSDRLWELVEHFAGEIVLADDRIRGRVRRETVRDWLSKHSLGGSTSLMGPISELLEQHGRLLVLTDSGGAESLIGQNAAVTDLGLPGDSSTKLLRVVKRDT